MAYWHWTWNPTVNFLAVQPAENMHCSVKKPKEKLFLQTTSLAEIIFT